MNIEFVHFQISTDASSSTSMYMHASNQQIYKDVRNRIIIQWRILEEIAITYKAIYILFQISRCNTIKLQMKTTNNH